MYCCGYVSLIVFEVAHSGICCGNNKHTSNILVVCHLLNSRNLPNTAYARLNVTHPPLNHILGPALYIYNQLWLDYVHTLDWEAWIIPKNCLDDGMCVNNNVPIQLSNAFSGRNL
jgi:hypothetical protein